MFGFPRIGKKNKKIFYDRRADIEPHEIFYDHLAKRHQERLDIGEKKFEISLSPKNLRLPLIAAAVFFAVALGRIIELQTAQSADLAKQAEQNKYIFYKVQSDRGIIYDRVLKPLVENLSTFDLRCTNQDLPSGGMERKKIISSLAAAAGVDADYLDQAITDNKNPTVENLDHRSLIVLEARIVDFPGCAIVKRPIRNYVSDAGLSHLLGYMGKIDSEEWKNDPDIYSISDYVGRAGLEKSYETVLRRDPGKLRIERDAMGNTISQDVSSAPQSGSSVQLWIDYGLQKKLHDSLKNQLANLGLKKGSAVAMDPKTGGIMALVSFPDYDNNAFSASDQEKIQQILEDKNNPLFNRAISGKYLTGSTIKPLEAAAALEEKIIKPEKTIYCQGKLTVQNRYNPEIIYTYNDNHTHGPTDMRKAIAESCNVYFYTIGGGYDNQQGLGPTRIKRYLDLFGWEEPTGVDLPGEVAGFVPDQAWKKERFSGTPDSVWSDGDTYNLAIGQGFIGITPLEVVNAFAAIANGGTLYKPRMVKSVIDNDKNIIEETKPEILRQGFIDPQNLQVVREGMRHAVNGVGAPLASALTLNQLGIPIAAKTGTAQLRKGADGKDLLNSWVSVFAPYDDPQIVITIMAEDVHEGTVAVLPVAKEVLGWYFGGQDDSAAVQIENQTLENEQQQNTASQPTDNAPVVPGAAQDLLPLLNLPPIIELPKPTQ